MPAERKVRRWPLVTQLTLALVFLVLVPIAAVVWINARDVERQSLSRATVALEHRTAEAASRVEERVGRLRGYVEQVATNPAILAAVRNTPSKDSADAHLWDEAHPEIHDLLVSVRTANPWFRNVYLLSKDGVCVSSSERGKTPAMVGRVYDYRPYFRAPLDNAAPYVSDVLKNATSTGTGIFVSAPIMSNGEVLAVAVLKVDSFALHDIVADLSQRTQRALLVDRFGVVVSDGIDGRVETIDKDTSLQFRPLSDVSRYVPRFEETKRYGDPKGSNYLDRIAVPLAVGELWAALRTQATGANEFEFPGRDGDPAVTMVGYSPVWSLSSEPYGYIVLAEKSAFREPLFDLGRDALVRFGVVIAAIGLVCMILIGRLARQVQGLKVAVATAGDAHADDKSADAALPPSASAPLRRGLVDRLLRRVRGPLATAEAELAALGDDANERTELARTHLAEGLDQLDGALLVAPGEPVIAMTRGRVVLLPLLQAAVDSARVAAELHETKVVLEAEDLGELTTDARKLALVLGNVLDNACQYTRRGTVRLAATRDEIGVEITVADDGIGMTSRQLERVTDPFADEPAAETPGLGVLIAKRTTELLGGSFAVTSNPDKGTTARIQLPLR